MGEDIHQIFHHNNLKTQNKTECKKINSHHLNTNILSNSNCYRSISTDYQIDEIIPLTTCSSSMISRAEWHSGINVPLCTMALC